jgi:adenylylsulfate kinase-like enzyme
VNDPYQPPLAPEIRVDAASANPEELLAAALHQLDGA